MSALKHQEYRYLTEDKAKALVQRHGIPVPAFRVVTNAAAAEAYVAQIGRPAAMKVIADGILHKSRHGCVALDVRPPDAAEHFEQLVARAMRVPNASVQGVLVEPMAPSGVEVIIGGLWDPAYGPVVMFGSGGTSVELLGDLGFRLAPIEREEAYALVRSTRIFQTSIGFGSEKRVDELVDVILRIAGPEGILLSEPIVELDLNPIIVSDGGIIAVDARLVVADARVEIGRPRDQKAIFETLRSAFTPSSVAVVGVSSNPEKLGYAAVKRLVEFGFAGELYGVNPNATGPICGCPTVRSVADLPHAFERADVFVPAEYVPDVLSDCAEKGIKVAQVYAAGFSEWNANAESIERSIHEVIAQKAIRVIGPNCFGTYCPDGRLTLIDARFSSPEPGRAMVVSQSGAYASDMVRRGYELGVKYSKVLSCGNCIDVDMTDYLLYADSDPETDIVGIYLELGRNLGELLRVAQRITKPIVILRGGRTQSGSRVAASHTGTVATDTKIFEQAATQVGVMLVDDLEEMFNLLAAYQAFGAISGRGLGIFGSGGGVAVVSADTAERRGMKVPRFAGDTLVRLSGFHQPGTIVSNPVDLPVWNLRRNGRYIHGDIVSAIAADPGVNSVIVYVEVGAAFDGRTDIRGRETVEEQVAELISHAPFAVPVSLVFRSGYSRIQEETVQRLRRESISKGIPAFGTMTEAIDTHARLAALYELRGGKVHSAQKAKIMVNNQGSKGAV